MDSKAVAGTIIVGLVVICFVQLFQTRADIEVRTACINAGKSLVYNHDGRVLECK